MAEVYPVVGIRDTGIHPRLEIRDLQDNAIQFSLFMRALSKIQDDRLAYANKPNSFWQISSIHGLPYEPWSGDPDGPQRPHPNSPYRGYCYHASALFPTWHRVAVLLIEQAVVNEAIVFASNLPDTPDKPIWVQASKELRFPFWDWSRHVTAQEGIPKIFQDAIINVADPNGQPDLQIKNPLNHYRFAWRAGRVKGFEYLGDWTRTWRWADRAVDPTRDQYNMALEAFSQEFEYTLPGGRVLKLKPVDWLRQKIAGLFHYPLTLTDPSYSPNMWGYFSNTGTQEERVYPPIPPTHLGSIEEPHNKVHLDIGGNGSMSFNEYASFDPIFFLHHCNIDRLYAFWEYLYPNYWIENGWKNEEGVTVPFLNDEDGNFQDGPNTQINHATPLLPFRTDVSRYWNSDNTRSLWNNSSTQKYYTYPAITGPTGAQVKVDVPYDTTNEERRREIQAILLHEWEDLPEILETVDSSSAGLHDELRKLLCEKDDTRGTYRLRHFVLLGHVPEFAFSGSYRLELYLRSNNPQERTVRVVNSISVLGRGNLEYCAACRDRRAAGSQVRGHMHLDPRFILYLIGQLDYTDLPALTDLESLGYMIKGKLWTRIVKPDGTLLASDDPFIDAEQHKSLEDEKAPNLTLHSYVTKFEQTVVRQKTIAYNVDLEEPESLGLFSEKQGGWKAYHSG